MKLLALLILIPFLASAQIETEGERFDDISNYIDITITFNQNTDCYAIMDEGYHRNINPALLSKLKAESVIVLEMFWYGSIHNYGKCKIRVTKPTQRFLFCTERHCYEFVAHKDYRGRDKVSLDFTYRNTEMWISIDGEVIQEYF